MTIDVKEITTAQLNKLGSEIEALLEVEKAARDWFIYASESGVITNEMTEFGVFETCRLAFEKLDKVRQG